MAEFRIITWNIRRSNDEWNDLLKLEPDVALVQEYIPDRKPSSSYIVKYPDYESDKTHRLAILIRKDYPWEYVDSPDIQGLLCYKITLPDDNKIFVINIHAKTSSKEGRNSTASTDHMTEILDVLTPFLNNYSGDNIVLGGDLNLDEKYNDYHNKTTKVKHKDVLKKIEDLKFINCTAKCKDKQTLFKTNIKKPWQNDYLYVRQNLERNFNPTKCIIHNTAEFTKYKDHVPVEIILEF